MQKKREFTSEDLDYLKVTTQVGDDVIVEACESLGADLDIEGQPEEVIAFFQFLTKTQGRFFCTLNQKSLEVVRKELARWFAELDEPETLRFAKLFELLNNAIDRAADKT
jgi:hypothetical protein